MGLGVAPLSDSQMILEVSSVTPWSHWQQEYEFQNLGSQEEKYFEPGDIRPKWKHFIFKIAFLDTFVYKHKNI